ncbi:hypothetical protein HJG60_008858 [Phyllostomus discolor]|uniref:Uncharacterized protein n=1 Tax=Phyllostomus discolor TaxID=89673 RepID=A0A833YSP0_9CHIR|nr:hypothetical protein HJG60_008858 [Phyllostomus discolor]
MLPKWFLKSWAAHSQRRRRSSCCLHGNGATDAPPGALAANVRHRQTPGTGKEMTDWVTFASWKWTDFWRGTGVAQRSGTSQPGSQLSSAVVWGDPGERLTPAWTVCSVEQKLSGRYRKLQLWATGHGWVPPALTS